MEGIVYLVCAATALACSLLLLRGYHRSHTRLLLWCGLCFLVLFGENVVLFMDVVLVPDVDLLMMRRALGLTGVGILIYGLVWDGPRR